MRRSPGMNYPYVTEALLRRSDYGRGIRYCPSYVNESQSAAFVVQFREGTDIGAGRLVGRVEHIASYRAARFHSVDDLLAFMARVLADVSADLSAPDPGPRSTDD